MKSLYVASIRAEMPCHKNVGTSSHVCWFYPYLERKLSVRQIAEQLGIGKNTLYVYLRHRNVPIGPYSPKKNEVR